MHATKSGWAGQAFAIATSNDSGGRKSRIRRSKEERKTMIESFIKKYQKSNNGNFPSLNLTHKEVGGSFYTVREIVREIIQENRVLAPPRVSLEEDGHSEFLEQHPLGSISIEPQVDLSASDRIHMATHIMPQYKTHEFEDEKIVNGFEVVEENTHSGKPLVMNVGHQDNDDSGLLSSQKLHGLGSQRSSNEQYHKENGTVVDKNNEFVQRIYRESAVMEILDREKDEAQDIEASQAIKSHMNSNVVVETFPLRPVPRTINNFDEESGNLREAAGTLDDKAIQSDKMTSSKSSSGFVNEKREQNLLDPTGESSRDCRDEKVVLNLQGPSLGTSNYQSAPKPSVLDIGDNADLESKDSLPDETKASSSSKRLTSENSSADKGKSTDRDNSSETWEGASKKPTESNPLLALVKAFVSSFVKFWTE